MQAKSQERKPESESLAKLPLCDLLGIDTGEQANRQGKGTKQAKKAKPKRRKSQKRKPKSSIPSGVATVPLAGNRHRQVSKQTRQTKAQRQTKMQNVSE